jgi:GT2 family glycosyltransferase
LRSVSVSIPCYNAGPVLRETVRAVLAQTVRPDQIILVDDGSTDGSCDSPYDRSVRVVRHGENRGLAAARNTALRACDSDVIAWFDADAVPRPDALECLLAGLAGDRVAGVGGREEVEPSDGFYDRWRMLHAPQSHGQRAKDDWMLMGLCCCYRRESLMEAGGFDERFRACGEDVEMGLRLSRMGCRLRYEPSARVMHRQHDTRASLLDRMESYLFWTLVAHRIHGRFPAARYLGILAKQVIQFPAADLVVHRSTPLAKLSLLVTARRLRALRRAWREPIDVDVEPSKRVAPV